MLANIVDSKYRLNQRFNVSRFRKQAVNNSITIEDKETDHPCV